MFQHFGPVQNCQARSGLSQIGIFDRVEIGTSVNKAAFVFVELLRELVLFKVAGSKYNARQRQSGTAK
jgi:hypothetical protein